MADSAAGVPAMSSVHCRFRWHLQRRLRTINSPWLDENLLWASLCLPPRMLGQCLRAPVDLILSQPVPSSTTNQHPWTCRFGKENGIVIYVILMKLLMTFWGIWGWFHHMKSWRYRRWGIPFSRELAVRDLRVSANRFSRLNLWTYFRYCNVSVHRLPNSW